MQLGGGLFVACVGAALIAGAVLGERFLGYYLISGMLAGIAAILITRRSVAMRLGRPSGGQIGIFLFAVVFELAVFLLLGRAGYFLDRSLLSIWQTGLAIVALHFLIMRWSHGPLMLLLAIAILIWIALCITASVSLVPMIVGDGALKILFGLIMAIPLLKLPISFKP